MLTWSDQILLRVQKLRALFVVSFSLLFIRLFYLLILLHPFHTNRVEKLPIRSETTPVSRGKIEDALGVPLSSNKTIETVFLSFKPIKNIPSLQVQSKGLSRDRIYPRRQYVEKLSNYLSLELLADSSPVYQLHAQEILSQKIRDFIYSTVALAPDRYHPLPIVPSRKAYLRLKSSMHLWPGLQLKTRTVRHLAQQRDLDSTTLQKISSVPIASHVLGFIGPMNASQWRYCEVKRRGLIAQLQLEEEPLSRQWLQEDLEQLEGRMYRKTDFIGQDGVEKLYEEWLRGSFGHSILSVNARGERIGKPEVIQKPKPPQSVRLTLHAPLQLYCQKVLASLQPDLCDLEGDLNIPWIKPASIVVMQPSSGKILAMASYPDFDGNILNSETDLHGGPVNSVERSRFLGDHRYVLALWEGKAALKQGCLSEGNQLIENNYWLKWKDTVTLIAGEGSAVLSWFESYNHLQPLLDTYLSFLTLQRYLGDEFRAGEILDFVKEFEKLQASSFQNNHYLELETSAHELPKELSLDQRQQALVMRWMDVNDVLGLRDCVEKLHILDALTHTTDRLLVLDLIALLFKSDAINTASVAQIEKTQLSDVTVTQFREDTQACFFAKQRAKELAFRLFEKDDFASWRKSTQNSFLKNKRKNERAAKTSPKPYQYYLEEECIAQFNRFWEEHASEIMQAVLYQAAVSDVLIDKVEAIQELFWITESYPGDGFKGAASRRMDSAGLVESNCNYLQKIVCNYKVFTAGLSFDEITLYEKLMLHSKEFRKSLLGTYPRLRVGGREATQLDFVSLVAQNGFEPAGYLKNRTFQEAVVPGSIFKLAVSYEALCQKYRTGARNSAELNPFTFYDKHSKGLGGKFYVGLDQNQNPIPQVYDGGRIPRSLSRHIGEVDLLRALEFSSNPYFALLAHRILDHGGDDLLKSARNLGYGEKTNFDLAGETRGFVPLSYKGATSALYSASIGQDRFLATPMQTACLLSAIANGGYLLKPQIIDSWYQQGRRHQKTLEIRREIFMPTEVRSYLLEGMRRVVTGTHGSLRLPHATSSAKRAEVSHLAPYIVGKTSTAEVDLRSGLSPSAYKRRENHIWFGAISFKEPLFTKASRDTSVQVEDYSDKTADLVVVALLKQGHVGRDLALACYRVISFYKEHCAPAQDD